jgi:glutaredoxin 3
VPVRSSVLHRIGVLHGVYSETKTKNYCRGRSLKPAAKMSALDPDKAPQFFDAMCRKNKVVIISATYCTFCTKIKMLLIELKHRFVTLEIDIIPNGRALFKEVQARTKINTVPQVFVQGKHIGGYDEIMDMHKAGKLDAALNAK